MLSIQEAQAPEVSFVAAVQAPKVVHSWGAGVRGVPPPKKLHTRGLQTAEAAIVLRHQSSPGLHCCGMQDWLQVQPGVFWQELPLAWL